MKQSAPLRSNQIVILALALITFVPVLLATASYFFFKPKGGHAYGELLGAPSLPALALTDLEGKPASLDRYHGKWVLLVTDDGACNESCADALFALQQIRAAQGVQAPRIQRVWLATGGEPPGASARAAALGADILVSHDVTPLAADANQYIYLIDPLGNEVIRYERSLRLVGGPPVELPDVAALQSLRGGSASAGVPTWLMQASSACDGECMNVIREMEHPAAGVSPTAIAPRKVWVLPGGGEPSRKAREAAGDLMIIPLATPLPLPGHPANSFYVFDAAGRLVSVRIVPAERRKVIGEIGKILRDNESLG